MAFTLKLDGLEQTLKKLEKLDDEVKADVDEEIGFAVVQMEGSAKRFAPVNDGFLKSEISAKKVTNLTWELVSAAPYSAYMEFGTKSKFDNVNGYEQLAQAAKGKGSGTYKKFLDSLTRWVEKKIGKKDARNIAFLIARKIMIYGVKGNHYFTRGIEAHRGKMIENIKKAINK